MKKLFVLSLAILGLMTSVSAHAQAESKIETSLQANTRAKRASGLALMPAITVGATQFTNLDDFGNQADTQTGTSLGAGILAEFGRGRVVFQTGAMYMGLASKVSENSAAMENGVMIETQAEHQAKVGYLAIPLAVKGRARVVDGVRLAGRFGVMPAIALSQELTTTGTRTINNFNEQNINETDSSAKIRTVNAFVIAGGGPEFAIGRNQNLRTELGYERMLMSAMENQKFALHSLNLMLSYAAGF